MSQITVDPDLCVRDGACIAVCPSKTLEATAEGLPFEIPDSRCISCGHCTAVCASGAIQHSGLPAGEYLPMPSALPSPVQLDGLLNSRRSIRAYAKKTVNRPVLSEILNVARRAPTATNSQRLHWIVVDTPSMVRKIAAETVNGLRASGQNTPMFDYWDQGYDFVLRGAPALVVCCAPTEYAWGRPDAAIALSYLELAAESRGLGACWAGYLTRVAATWEPLRQKLLVPHGMSVCGGLMLGYAEHTYYRVPPRKPLSVQWV